MGRRVAYPTGAGCRDGVFAGAWALLLLYRWPAGDADWPGWFYGVVGLMTATFYVGGPFGC